jgi:precorrin-3B synthase
MSHRRGACPGIAEPMPTGDGLLARLIPRQPIALGDFFSLLDASIDCGNGVIEVTQRGSLQIRGLSTLSAPLFADTITSLGLGEEQGPPLLSAPLLGMTKGAADLHPLVTQLRTELSNNPRLTGLGPKVSVVLDGDPWLLDSVSADLRLVLESDGRLQISIAGSAADAKYLGWAEPDRAAAIAAFILEQIAGRGPTARARDFSTPQELSALRSMLAAELTAQPAPARRALAEPLGIRALACGRVVLGIALPFGYAHAAVLQRLLMAAARYGASSVRPAPGRTLLMIGLPATASSDVAAAAAALGFIVDRNDVRRFVIACAGAPACASAKLSTRQLAPAIADAAHALLDGSILIHVSGCSKGCAHAGVAALTLVGPDQLVVLGSARTPGQQQMTPAHFISGLKLLAAQCAVHAAPDSGELLSRLGARRIAELMTAETVSA